MKAKHTRRAKPPKVILAVSIGVILCFAAVALAGILQGKAVAPQEESKPESKVSSMVLSSSGTSSAAASSQPPASSAVLSQPEPSQQEPSQAPSSAAVNNAGEKTPTDQDIGFGKSVFIGDSRTEGLRDYNGLGKTTYFALRGLMVSTVATRPAVTVNGQRVTVLKALSYQQYDRVYIMLGLNELGWSSSATFVKKYGDVIDGVRAAQPNAKIYVQSILPITAKRSASDDIYNNTKVNSFNGMIEKLAKEKQVEYLDVASALRGPDGALPADASADGVHLKTPYLQKWCDYLIANANP